MSPLDPGNPVTPPRPARPASSPRVEHAPAAELAVVAAGPVPPVLTAMPSAGALWSAFGRRWPLALSLALIAGGLVGFGIWQLVPAPFVSELYLQLDRAPTYMSSNGATQGTYDDYLRSQATLFKSGRVRTAAVQNPDVRGLPTGQGPDAAERLNKNLTIKFLTGDNYLPIKLAADDAQEAATVLSALHEAYKDSLRAERESQLQRMKDSLRQLEVQRNKLGESTRPFTPKQLEDTLTELNRVQTELRSARSELELRKDRMAAPTKEAIADYADTILAANPEASDLRRRLTAKKQEIDEIASVSQRGVNDPMLVVPRRQLGEMEAEMEGLRKSATERARRRLEDEAKRVYLATLAPLVDRVNSLEARERALLIEAESLRARDTPEARARAIEVQVLDKALGQLQDSITQIDLHKGNNEVLPWVKPMGAPTVPAERDRELQLKVAGFGAAGAFGLVLFLVSLTEFRTRRVTSPDEVTHGLGIPTVGTIPVVPARSHRAALAGGDAHWQGRLAESVDAVRTLMLRALGDGPRVVLVTSAVPGEGKTSLASQLAASLARAWRKTLLVDGDLRKPAAHLLFDLPVEPGLCEVLRGDLEVVDVVRPTKVARLSVMPAGRWDAHAVQALAQEGVGTLFEQLKDEYEFVVVDSCPVLAVTDTLLVGQHVDTVLLSVLRGTSKLPTLYGAHQRLAALDIPVLGAVVVGGHSTLGGLDIQYPRPVAS